MKEIKLPFGSSMYVCEVCGYTSESEEQMRDHEAIPVDVPVLEVKLPNYGRVTLKDGDDYEVGFYYYSPDGVFFGKQDRPHTHQLCVLLAHETETGGYAWENMQYSKFLENLTIAEEQVV